MCILCIHTNLNYFYFFFAFKINYQIFYSNLINCILYIHIQNHNCLFFSLIDNLNRVVLFGKMNEEDVIFLIRAELASKKDAITLNHLQGENEILNSKL